MQKWEYLVIHPGASQGKSIGFSPNKVDVAPLVNKYPIKFVNFQGEPYDDGWEHLCHKSLRFRLGTEGGWFFDGGVLPTGLFQEFLDLVGQQGWELVSVSPVTLGIHGSPKTNYLHYTFKRPMPD